MSERSSGSARRRSKGNAHAQVALGECYLNGTGVEKDDVEAVKWFRKAAEQGNAHAQVKLGECYRNGTGVEKDDVGAVKWFRKAAEQGRVIGEAAQ